MGATFTIRLDDETAASLRRRAAEEGRPPEEIAASAVEAWVEPTDEDIQAIRAGIADAEAGRTVPHDAVVRWLRSWGTPEETPPPKWPD